MELNSLSSTNFKGQAPKTVEIDPQELKSYISESEPDSFDKEEALNDYADKLVQIKQNVHPLTCLAGVASAVIAMKKGRNVVGALRGVSAKTIGVVSNAALNIAQKVSKKANFDSARKAVDSFTQGLAAKTNENNSKITKSFVDTVDTIFAKTVDGVREEKGAKMLSKLNDNGVYLNKGSLFDNGIALAGGLFAADKVSDITENSLDNSEIKKETAKIIDFIAD